jgi:Tfp pilus assembly pilus retraction ATPase PilT
MKMGLLCPNASDLILRAGRSHFARRSQGTVRHDRRHGPTGSGKTTTLAASLCLINELSRNILTEIPSSIQLPGSIKHINHAQVRLPGPA